MIRFDKINSTHDYRYLLKCDELVDFDESLLIPIWDKICNEYDEISGNHEFKAALEDDMEMLGEYNRLVGLRSAFILMRLNQKEALEYLDYWDLPFKVNYITHDSIMKVRSYIMSEQTRITIESLENRAEVEKTNKNKGSLIRMMVTAENVLKRSLPDKNKITVTEWVYIMKDVNTIIAQMKKNGRT